MTSVNVSRQPTPAENILREAELLGAAPRDRQRLLADALVTWGAELITWDDAESNRPQTALDEAQRISMDWAYGMQLTSRADEDEARLTFGMQLAEWTPAATGLVARAILLLPEWHPKRSADRARELIEAGIADGSATARTHALAAHLLFPEVGEADWNAVEDDLLRSARNASRLARQDAFHTVFVGRIRRAVPVADRPADPESVERARQYGAELQADGLLGEGFVGCLAELAFAHLNGDVQRAADAYGRARQYLPPGSGNATEMFLLEAHLRYQLGEFGAAATLVDSALPALELGYVAAIGHVSAQKARKDLADALSTLTRAYLQDGNWPLVLGSLERGKSIRLRYRALLRRAGSHDRVTWLENDLSKPHSFSPAWSVRGGGKTAGRPVTNISGSVDRTTQRREEYRRRCEWLIVPGHTAVPDPPPPGEALVVLGFDRPAVILGMVTSGSKGQSVTGRRLRLPWDWFRALGDDETGREWLPVVAGIGFPEEPHRALSRWLRITDWAIGRPLARLLTDAGIRRVTLVPHQELHLVPWSAVRSLQRFDMRVAPAAAIRGRTRSDPPQDLSAEVIANPTDDLPLSEVEAAVVAHHLERAGYRVEMNVGNAARIPRLLLSTVLHIAAHGRANVARPDETALLLRHTAELIPDPSTSPDFGEWHDEPDQDLGGGRYADWWPFGRLTERIDYRTSYLERRWRSLLPFDNHCDVELWDGARLALRAREWAAEDIARQHWVGEGRLVTMSACSSGVRGLVHDGLDEGAALPLAFHIAGAAAVVSALWPVDDALSVLMMDLLYAELLAVEEAVDIAAAVRRMQLTLRTMSRAEAIERVTSYRRYADRPRARAALASYARRLGSAPARPFAHPYDWASFATLGSPVVALRPPSPTGAAAGAGAVPHDDECNSRGAHLQRLQAELREARAEMRSAWRRAGAFQRVARAQWSVWRPRGMTAALGLCLESVRLEHTLEGDLCARELLDLAGRPNGVWRVGGDVKSMAVGPDGSWLVLATTEGTALVFDEDRPSVSLEGLAAAVAAGPDGSRVAVAWRDGSVSVIDAVSGQRNWTRIMGSAPWSVEFRSIAFSPDGQWLAVSAGQDLRVLGTEDGADRFHVLHDGWILQVIFSANGRWLATADDGGTARLLDASTGAEAGRLVHPDRDKLGLSIHAVAIAGNGQLLALGSGNGSVSALEVNTEHLFEITQAAVYGLAVDPAGQWLVTAGADGAVRLFEMDSGRERWRYVHSGSVNAVASSQDGTRVATASSDGYARIFAAESGEELARIAHDEPVEKVGFSADGNVLASASGTDCVARLSSAWGAAGYRGVVVGERGRCAVRAIRLAPDGSWFAIVVDDEVRVFDRRPQKGERFRVEHGNAVQAVEVSPDGSWIATLDNGGSGRIVDTGTGETRSRWAHPSLTSNALAVSGNGRWVASGGFELHVIDVTSGARRLTARWSGSGSRISALALNRDGSNVAVGYDGGGVAMVSADDAADLWRAEQDATVSQLRWLAGGGRIAAVIADTVRILDTRTGGESLRVHHDDEITALAVSPDGRWIVTGCSEGTARVIDIQTGSELARLHHDDGVTAVAVDDSGSWVATASSDHTARVFAARSGVERSRLYHLDRVTDVAFEVGGEVLATASHDGTGRLWPVGTSALIAVLTERMAREPTGQECLFSPETCDLDDVASDGDVFLHTYLEGHPDP